MDFQVISGTIFSLAVVLEYLPEMADIFRERKSNYVANKGRDAVKSCQALQDILLREFQKVMTTTERGMVAQSIEDQKQLIYSFFSLDGTDQYRVKQLMIKLKKEKA
jgi:flagellar biosynthesis/type III secretory pathway chaperone